MSIRKFVVIFVFIFFMPLVMTSETWAVDNDTFTKLFKEYEDNIEDLIHATLDNRWTEAQSAGNKLVKQAFYLKTLAEEDNNEDWQFDASNLWHHSEEVVQAIKKQDRPELIYLFGILSAHIGYIQAANPVWLKDYLAKQIEILEDGISHKKKEQTRDSAEILHTSANKIVLSSGFKKEIYQHLRWIDSVRELNGLGDDIIGQVNSNDWSGPKEKLQKIKVIYDKWVKSFKK